MNSQTKESMNKELIKQRIEQASCMDCEKPYDDFKLDMILPRGQWLEINPDGNGLLCAQCIINRAAKISGVIVIHAVLEIAPNRTLVTKKQ